MLAKAVEAFLQFIGLFYVWCVLDPWEVAVVLRFGKYHRTLQPGRHWVWPLKIETLNREWTVPVCKILPSQNLTTKDGKAVMVTPAITYLCEDPVKLLVELGGHESFLLDSTCGAVAEQVARTVWSKLPTSGFVRRLTKKVAANGKDWGVKVIKVQLSDVTLSRTFRLVGLPARPVDSGS